MAPTSQHVEPNRAGRDGVLGPSGGVDPSQLYVSIVENCDDAIFAESMDGLIVAWNDSAARLYGRDASGMIGRSIDELMPADQLPMLRQLRRLAHEGVRSRHVEMTHRRDDGLTVEVSINVSPLRDVAGRVAGASVIARDISEQKRIEAQLRHDAAHDKLTGLPNVAVFHDRVNRAIERKKRYPAHHFAVLFLDLDRFKIINDSLGHSVGDQLLLHVSDQLRGLLRGVDTASRLGGDEFAVLLDGLDRPQDAALVAKRMIETLARPARIGAHEVITTASIGIVTSEEKLGSAEAALRDADNAMYHAKSRGRNTFAMFDSPMHAAAMQRLELEKDLRQALNNSQVELHYQPVVSLETGRCLGFEALLRWQHPVHGWIGPDRFIPLAEEVGLIHPLGDWVFNEAAAQMRRWLDRFGEEAALKVNVNVSRLQLGRPNVVSRFCAMAAAHGVSRSRIMLEITESVMMDDRAPITPVLTELREAGFALAMDDFGTGHSSLSCLHRFPIESLKIDRSFVLNMGARIEYLAVVRTIVTLAHALNIGVVAEGVESADQLVQLQALECDSGQGYFFAKPMSALHATRYLRQILGDAQSLRPAG